MNGLAYQTERMIETLLDEVQKVVPLTRKPGVSRAYHRMARRPIRRFSEMLVQFDSIIGEEGMNAAAQWFLPRLVDSLTVVGAERVPTEGPLLVVGNHPGSMDLIAYLAALPRPDLNLVGGHPALLTLDKALNHIIYVRPKAVRAPGEVTGMIIDKLRDGQCVIIFPRGKMEPDPAWFQGGAQSLEHWRSSVNYFVASVPGLQVLPATVGGAISKRALNSPLVSHFKNIKTRQRYGLLVQIFGNLIFPGRYPVHPSVRFGSVLTKEEKGKWLFPAVLTEMEQMMPHMRRRDFPLAKGVRGWKPSESE